MARQQPTSAEQMQVANDFETFFLPFDASLDLGDRTAYGTTDPTVDLSMVNIRHLNNTRGFRGEWTGTPTDGSDADGLLSVPYRAGQVVVGSNNVIYQLNAMGNPATNPTTAMQTDWTPLGIQLSITDGVDIATTGAPGLVSSNVNGVISLSFRGYRGGNGISIDNDSGTIDAVTAALTDVHTFESVRDRNRGFPHDGGSQLSATIEWHVGDVAIVMTDANAVGTGATRQGRGTYVYTGTEQTAPGNTTNNDWTLLQLPETVVTTVAGVAGPTVTTQNIVDAINADSFTGGQILTEAQAMRVASRYSADGAPAANFAMGTRETGDIYIDTDSDNFYYFDGDNWQQANPATLGVVGDVYLTNPMLDDHLVYSTSAGPMGEAGWHNQRPSQVSGRSIALGDLMNVQNASLANNDILQYNTDVTPNRWENITLADLQAQFGLTNLNDVTLSTPTENQIIRYNDTTDMWENATARTLVSDTTNGVRLEDLSDVNPTTAGSQFLRRNAADDGWEPVLLSAAADTAGTAGISLQNLNDVDNNDNPANNDVLVWNTGIGWHPQSPAETAVNQLDNVGDVAAYATTTTSYIAQAVQENVAFVTTTNIVNIPMDTPFRDDAANPQNVYFVPNNDFITDAGRTSITETTFNNANAVGPFNLTQAVGGNGSLYFHTAANGPAATDIANRINAIAGNAVAVTQRVGAAHPPVGSIIHWVETNQITGVGEWRYEVLSTHTNTTVDLDDLRDVEYPAAPTIDQSLVWNPSLRSGDGAWEPRSEHRLRIRAQDYFPLAAAGNNVEILDLTRTVIATRAADTIAPVATRSGTPGNYSYTIRTDSTDGGSAVQVQPGDLYVAGNRDLYYGSLDASDDLIFREILHPASQSGRTIRLDQLPTPTDTSQRQFIRWNPLADNNNGAWEITDEDETSLTTIFDIGDVDRRVDGSNPVYSFPDTNVISGSRTNAATLIQDLDVNITFTATSTGLDSIQPGDRIAFWNGIGPTDPGTRNFQDNGGMGFVVQTINHESPIMMTIHSPDNMPISETTVRDLAGQLRVVTATVTGTTGQQSPLFNGDMLQYNATLGAWENTPLSITGAITGISAGDIGPDGQTTNTATQDVNVVAGQAYIEDVTVDRSGVMNPSDKQKLDDFPSRPTTPDGNPVSPTNPVIPVGQTDHYALSVEHTTGTGPEEYRETWVNISDIVAPGGGSNLVFTDAADTNSTTLTGYRQGSTLRSVISASTSTNQFIIELGRFNPMFSFTPATNNLRWDQPWSSTRINVDNPVGVTRYIDRVSAISVGGNAHNTALTLADFTAGAQSATPAAEVDWNQTFTGASIRDSGTSATGGTVSATYTLADNDGTNFGTTATQDIVWGNVAAGNPTASLVFTNYNFYERSTQLRIAQSISGLQTASNGSITWTRGAGLTGGTLTGTNSLTSTFNISNILYKDNRNLDADAIVTADANATRPATITGTQYSVDLNNGTSNRPSLGAPIMPFFRLTTTGETVTPTAYGTTAPAILTGDFTTGNGLTVNSGITRETSIGDLGFTLNVPTTTYYWFGRQGTIAPTLRVNTGLGNLEPSGTTTHTVTFSRAAMTGSNVPAGWTDVTYTFIGVSINAGQTTVIVS